MQKNKPKQKQEVVTNTQEKGVNRYHLSSDVGLLGLAGKDFKTLL